MHYIFPSNTNSLYDFILDQVGVECLSICSLGFKVVCETLCPCRIEYIQDYWMGGGAGSGKGELRCQILTRWSHSITFLSGSSLALVLCSRSEVTKQSASGLNDFELAWNPLCLGQTSHPLSTPLHLHHPPAYPSLWPSTTHHPARFLRFKFHNSTLC